MRTMFIAAALTVAATSAYAGDVCSMGERMPPGSVQSAIQSTLVELRQTIDAGHIDRLGSTFTLRVREKLKGFSVISPRHEKDVSI